MKKLIFSACAAAMLLTSCAKQSPNLDSGAQSKVVFTVGLQGEGTKAVADYDGNAAKANHWVMEVRDAQDSLFYREVKSATEGTLEQTFEVTFIKGQTYNLLFWADNDGGYYNSDNLTKVYLTDTTTFAANVDARDAFTAKKSYTASASGQIKVELYRPFAQLNMITTDLPTLWAQAQTTPRPDSTYAKNEPKQFVAKIKIPTSFNVLTQTCGAVSTKAVSMTADRSYFGYEQDKVTPQDTSTYFRKVNPATLFMDYVFASSEKQLVDVEFSFQSNSVNVDYNWTSVPVQANYRTNIKGNLLSDKTTVQVEIKPAWLSPDYDVQK